MSGEQYVVEVITPGAVQVVEVYVAGPPGPAGGGGGGASPVQSVAGKTGDVLLNKADVGLSNVDNTSDASKPVSAPQQAALDAKASAASLTSHTSDTANPHGTTKAQVGLGNVDNTSDASKPVSTAQATAIAAKMTNPMTTAGDLVIGGTSGAPARLAASTAGYVLTMVSGAPAWAVAATGSTIALAATWVEASGNDSTGALGNPAKPFATIDAALDALPATGGVIHIGVGTFAPVTDDYQGSTTPDPASKLKSDVWFCGSGMPRFKSDNTGLVGGTIIKGSLIAHSTRHGLKFTDLGIDCGSAVCAELYGGVAQDTLDFANVSWTVGLAQCEGVVVHNVRTIGQSASGVSHTMLFENLKNPDVRNVSGRFGSLGVVIKSDGGTFDGIESSGHGTSALYIKEGNTGSNSAPCKEVNISNVSLSALSAGDTPYAITMVAAGGQPLRGIQIDNLIMRGITTAEFRISSETAAVSDCRVNNARTDAGAVRVAYDNSTSVDKASIYINGQPLDGVVTLTDGATINTDASKGSGVFKVTLGGTGRTLANPTNLVPGQTYVWQIVQDATGSRTITAFGSAFSFSGGTPTQSTAASAVDVLTAVYDGAKLRAVYTKGFA